METRRTGLEPATTGSTGRDSNQLSYRPLVLTGSQWSPELNSVAMPLRGSRRPLGGQDYFVSYQDAPEATSTTRGTHRSMADSMVSTNTDWAVAASASGTSTTSSS